LKRARRQTIGTRGHIESDIREGGFCATLFKTARNLLILNGEMSEWSIEHAWKAIRATLTEEHGNTPSHIPFNDLAPQNAA
jgi:hypothetical protein